MAEKCTLQCYNQIKNTLSKITECEHIESFGCAFDVFRKSKRDKIISLSIWKSNLGYVFNLSTSLSEWKKIYINYYKDFGWNVRLYIDKSIFTPINYRKEDVIIYIRNHFETFTIDILKMCYSDKCFNENIIKYKSTIESKFKMESKYSGMIREFKKLLQNDSIALFIMKSFNEQINNGPQIDTNIMYRTIIQQIMETNEYKKMEKDLIAKKNVSGDTQYWSELIANLLTGTDGFEIWLYDCDYGRKNNNEPCVHRGIFGLFPRFQPFEDKNVNIVVSRNLELLSSKTERDLLEKWIKDGTAFCIFTTSKYVCGNNYKTVCLNDNGQLFFSAMCYNKNKYEYGNEITSTNIKKISQVNNNLYANVQKYKNIIGNYSKNLDSFIDFVKRILEKNKNSEIIPNTFKIRKENYINYVNTFLSTKSMEKVPQYNKNIPETVYLSNVLLSSKNIDDVSQNKPYPKDSYIMITDNEYGPIDIITYAVFKICDSYFDSYPYPDMWKKVEKKEYNSLKNYGYDDDQIKKFEEIYEMREKLSNVHYIYEMITFFDRVELSNDLSSYAYGTDEIILNYYIKPYLKIRPDNYTLIIIDDYKKFINKNFHDILLRDGEISGEKISGLLKIVDEYIKNIYFTFDKNNKGDNFETFVRNMYPNFKINFKNNLLLQNTIQFYISEHVFSVVTIWPGIVFKHKYLDPLSFKNYKKIGLFHNAKNQFFGPTKNKIMEPSIIDEMKSQINGIKNQIREFDNNTQMEIKEKLKDIYDFEKNEFIRTDKNAQENVEMILNQISKMKNDNRRKNEMLSLINLINSKIILLRGSTQLAFRKQLSDENIYDPEKNIFYDTTDQALTKLQSIYIDVRETLKQEKLVEINRNKKYNPWQYRQNLNKLKGGGINYFEKYMKYKSKYLLSKNSN